MRGRLQWLRKTSGGLVVNGQAALSICIIILGAVRPRHAVSTLGRIVAKEFLIWRFRHSLLVPPVRRREDALIGHLLDDNVDYLLRICYRRRQPLAVVGHLKRAHALCFRDVALNDGLIGCRHRRLDTIWLQVPLTDQVRQLRLLFMASTCELAIGSLALREYALLILAGIVLGRFVLVCCGHFVGDCWAIFVGSPLG